MNRYYGVSYNSIESTKEQIAWYESLVKENTGFWWAICCKDDGSFYGAIGANEYDKKHHKAALGYWLLKEYWGRRLMKEAGIIVCKKIFEMF